jgi:hypothetical protein
MIVVAGPYIGSFEQEIITFRPYVKWLQSILKPSKMYINTHSNRTFLYESGCIFPVNEYLSRDEQGQRGYIHREINPKDYQMFVKDIKERIAEKELCNKKDIPVYSVNYVKSTPPISIYRKVFDPIDMSKVDIPWSTSYTNRVVFIPSNTEKKYRLSKVRDLLKNYDGYMIAGDTKTRFRKQNRIMSRVDYFENGFKLIIKIITEAKAVICPIGLWTTICNLQQVPVFSWGENVGQHKKKGVYYFGNKNSVVIPDTKMRIILNMLEHFLEGVTT